MTTGQQLSAWSTVDNVSAMEHFMNLAVGGGSVTFIPASSITAEVSQLSLDASVSYPTYSADVSQGVLDATIIDTVLDGNVSQITLEGKL